MLMWHRGKCLFLCYVILNERNDTLLPYCYTLYQNRFNFNSLSMTSTWNFTSWSKTSKLETKTELYMTSLLSSWLLKYRLMDKEVEHIYYTERWSTVSLEIVGSMSLFGLIFSCRIGRYEYYIKRVEST